MGRWVLWGWVSLAVIVAGLFLVFVLYSRIVIGVGLQEQFALLKLPESLMPGGCGLAPFSRWENSPSARI